MILECGHCGAPLDVKEGAETTRCRYCRTVNERLRMRTIASDTPRDFQPPKLWIPPPHMPMRVAKPLAYHAVAAPIGALVVSVVLALVGAAVAVGIVASRAKGRSSGGSIIGAMSGPTAQDLASLRIDQTPQAMAAALSATGSKTSVYAKLSDARFEYLSMSWDEAHPEHPTGFYLSAFPDAKSGGKPDPRIVAALSSKLHGGLENNNWNWGGVSVNVGDNGSISGHTNIEMPGHKKAPNPMWKEKLGAVWKLVLEAVFGFPAKIEPRSAFELIGAPHRFADVARIDPKTPIDNASAMVLKSFPGSIVSTFIDLDAEINVDHPLFRDARLSWENKKGGTLRGCNLRGNTAFVGRRDAFVQCLGTKLGPPRVNDTDYVNKKQNYSFQVASVYFSVSEKSAHLSGGSAGISPEGYSKVMGAVDACR